MFRGSRSLAARVAARLSVVAAVVAFSVTGCSGGNKIATESPSASVTTGAANGQRTVSTTYITYTSSQPFEATADALRAAAADNGMLIVGDINQDAELAANGLRLPGAHSFFVGNPQIGKTFFDATQAIGTVVPVRVHVWVDGDGPAHISYIDPAPEFTAVDPGLADAGQKISQAIRTIAAAAAAGGGTPQETKVETKFVTVDTSTAFEASIDALHSAADQNGMVILGDVNQASRLEAIGMQLQRSHSFFVGDPQIGKTLFGTTQAIGAVVPVRVHVWADARGPAHISYFDPAPLLTAIDPGRAEVGQQLSQAIHAIAEAAAAKR